MNNNCNNNVNNNNGHHFYSCTSGTNSSPFVSSNFNVSSNSMLHQSVTSTVGSVHRSLEYSHGHYNMSSISSNNNNNSSVTQAEAVMSHLTFPCEFNSFGSQLLSSSQDGDYTSDNRIKYPPCLPYGLYYDFDGEEIDDTFHFQLDKVTPFQCNKTTTDDDDEWAMDDSTGANLYDNDISKRLKNTIDNGPTLAELNCGTDATDSDDLFSHANTQVTTNCNIFKPSSLNYSTLPCNLSNNYESDSKLSSKFRIHNSNNQNMYSNSTNEDCVSKFTHDVSLQQSKLNEEIKLLKTRATASTCDFDVKENLSKLISSTDSTEVTKVNQHSNSLCNRESDAPSSLTVGKRKESTRVNALVQSRPTVSSDNISATTTTETTVSVATVSPATSAIVDEPVARKSATVTFCEASTSSSKVHSGEVNSSNGANESSKTTASNANQSTLVSPDLARVRNSSMSTEGSISSHDEGFASQQEESDEDDNDSSDDDSFYGDYDAKDLLGASTSDDCNNKWSLNIGRARKNSQQRYFWQYNVQAKGPKGSKVTTLSDDASTNDPHVLMEASDPVFAPECSIKGVKHAGKARRGDGNDLTPNPRKLLMIGLELKKLSHIINELTPVAEVPVNARGKSRKEKNKLASRACRLKKKAQHEANKIKLFGLQQEHKKTLAILDDMKLCIKQFTHDTSTLNHAKDLIGRKDSIPKVAGKTAEFVNMVCSHLLHFATASSSLFFSPVPFSLTFSLFFSLRTLSSSL